MLRYSFYILSTAKLELRLKERRRGGRDRDKLVPCLPISLQGRRTCENLDHPSYPSPCQTIKLNKR